MFVHQNVKADLELLLNRLCKIIDEKNMLIEWLVADLSHI